MTDAPDRDLDARIDRALAALPVPSAPSTLLPRVMAAVEAEAAWDTPLVPVSPSWRQWAWPARVAALAGAVGVVAFLIYGWSQFEAGTVLQLAGHDRAAEIWRTASAWLSATSAIGRVLQPVAVAGAVLMAIMLAACAALGAGIRAVAVGGSSS